MNKLKKALRLIRTRGLFGFIRAVGIHFESKYSKREVSLLVRNEDFFKVNIAETPGWKLEAKKLDENKSLNIAWVMSPPAAGSGGHQTLFRFIKYTEALGHSCSVYLYDARDHDVDVNAISELIKSNDGFAKVNATFHNYDSSTGVGEDNDVLFATGWETCYPVFADPSLAKRLYFVQDYEPYFYPVGSEYVLAQNTYRFGFDAITAGKWLSTKLAADFEMNTRSFDFAVDRNIYKRVNDEQRDAIFFYARPVTARRGFEYGLLVLQELVRRRPGTTIHMAGWDVSNWALPEGVINHGVVDVHRMNEIYNLCSAAFVMSLTNMSLLPFELMASGVVPIVNEGPNNRMVADHPLIKYIDTASPVEAVEALIDSLDSPKQVEQSRELARAVEGYSWDNSAKQYEIALNELLYKQTK